jgi:hypothetical protein
VAWIYRGSKGKWFYLESRIAGHRFHRALKTQSRAIAERELAKQLALEKSIPRPDGRIRWQSQDLEQFTGMPGQSRVARQNYACAAQAMAVLTDADRWAWLLKPAPKILALGALGRLQMEEMMRLAADEVCEKRMTYRAAVAFVRRLLDRHSAARPHTLRNSIRSACKVFRDMHPETTGQEIAATLRGLAADFENERGT